MEREKASKRASGRGLRVMNKIKRVVDAVLILAFFSSTSFAYSNNSKEAEFMLFENIVVICATSYTIGYKTKQCKSVNEYSKEMFSGYKDMSAKSKKNISKVAKTCCLIGVRDVKNKSNNFPNLYTTLYKTYKKISVNKSK